MSESGFCSKTWSQGIWIEELSAWPSFLPKCTRGLLAQWRDTAESIRIRTFCVTLQWCHFLVRGVESLGTCSWTWVSDFQIYRFPDLKIVGSCQFILKRIWFWKIEGNSKCVLDRPCTKRRVISSTLKFQFTENHATSRFYYSMIHKIGDPGPIKLRTIFPDTSVLSKPHQLQYWGNTSSFSWQPSFFPGSLTSAWEVRIDRSDRITKGSARKDQWVQPERSVRLAALWLSGRSTVEMEPGVNLGKAWFSCNTCFFESILHWQDGSVRKNGRVSDVLSHRIAKSLTSMIYGKLECQCTRNCTQNHPFCLGSIQDAFIIYSSISHNHISQADFAKHRTTTR